MKPFCAKAIIASSLSFGFASALWAAGGPTPPEPPPLNHPKPPPAQVSSSEGVPPLPYPAVMQKRQEKKNPPQPPVLLTKIATSDAEDWTRTPDDLKGLLQWMSKEMNVNFSANIKQFGEMRKMMKSPHKMSAMMKQMGGIGGMKDMMKGMGGKMPF